jgi:hypothetical protein
MSNLQNQTPAFFAVSTTKLVVMSVCTLGFYQIYWFYRNWQLIRIREQSRISAPWRSVFGVIFCYPLLRRIKTSASERGLPAPPAAMAVAWIVVVFLGYLPEPYLLLSFASVFCLIPAQRTANDINSIIAPETDRNSRFGAWNITAVVIGGLFFALALVGAFLGPEQA